MSDKYKFEFIVDEEDVMNLGQLFVSDSGRMELDILKEMGRKEEARKTGDKDGMERAECYIKAYRKTIEYMEELKKTMFDSLTKVEK